LCRINFHVCRLKILVGKFIFFKKYHDSPPKIASDAFNPQLFFFLQTFSIFVLLQKLDDHNFQTRKRFRLLQLQSPYTTFILFGWYMLIPITISKTILNINFLNFLTSVFEKSKTWLVWTCLQLTLNYNEENIQSKITMLLPVEQCFSTWVPRNPEVPLILNWVPWESSYYLFLYYLGSAKSLIMLQRFRDLRRLKNTIITIIFAIKISKNNCN